MKQIITITIAFLSFSGASFAQENSKMNEVTSSSIVENEGKKYEKMDSKNRVKHADRGSFKKMNGSTQTTKK